ncbi:hypothetical protein FRC11_010598 [Ceratobasidium sp. 423]|nr:hypothetical protein FRC11_010598 [Ceratobasidium sp. 423]
MTALNAEETAFPADLTSKSSAIVLDNPTKQAQRVTNREQILALEGDSRLESCKERLKKFAEEGAPTLIDVVSITLEEAENIQATLSAGGIKYRFDWNAKTSTATFRMTKKLHSSTLATFTHRAFAEFEHAVLAASPCRMQKELLAGGDANIDLEDGGSLQPDASFAIKEGEAGESGESKGLWRRVVIESLLSQTMDQAEKKLIRLLFETKEHFEVHAVILINFENPPTIHSDEEKCIATVEVWVRKPTSNRAKDFPKDKCSRKDSATPEPDTEQEGPSSSNEEDSDADTQVTGWASNASTIFATPPKVIGGPGNRAMRRTAPIIVYDESKGNHQEPLETLLLDAYDFFRKCRRKRQAIPSNKRLIEVNLEPLRDAVRTVLHDERQQLVVQRQELTGVSPARGPPTESTDDSSSGSPEEEESYGVLAERHRRKRRRF